MKKILPAVLVFCSFIFNAQTLTQAATEPIVNDHEALYGLDTSAFTSGMPTHVTGNNVTWNFTNFVAIPPADTNFFVDPSTVANSSSYPGCTVVQRSGPLYTYFKSVTTPTTETQALGIKSTGLSLTFTNPAVVMRYPFSFGSTSTDNIAGTFTIATYNGSCSGVITNTADGFGTLNLPNGYSYTNVLRVKSTQSLTFTQIIPLGSAVQTIYNYYHSSQKFPILSINYTTLSLITSPTPTVTGFATGNITSFTVGLKESSLGNRRLTIYPNPAQTDLTVTLDNHSIPKEIKVYTQLGQLILSETETNTIDISTLNTGIYFIDVRADESSFRRKIIKQ